MVDTYCWLCCGTGSLSVSFWQGQRSRQLLVKFIYIKMEKSNPLFTKDYPEWKKNLWGAGRAFVGGFLGALATFLLTLNADTILDKDWWLRMVLVGCFVGGFIALGKFLRDLFPENAVLARLPF